MIRQVMLALATVLCIAMPAFGADIEYDPVKEVLILKGPAAKMLLDLVRDKEELQDVVRSMAQEIQKRAESDSETQKELTALRAALTARQGESAMADFIVKNYQEMKQGFRDELTESRAQRIIERDGLTKIIDIQTAEIKALRGELRWSKITGVVGLLLGIFSFGLIGF